MTLPLIIAPSILAGNFGAFAAEATRAEAAGGDWLHLDVMDGHFVPNITFGADVVRAVRPATKRPLDVHLMIERPDKYAPRFIEVGADSVSIHIEAPCDVAATLKAIRAAGKLAGIALNPPTPVSDIEPLLDAADIVLVMTVNPGFGGQSFIPETLDKVKQVAALREQRRLNFHIEVDGGISEKTAGACVAAGANVFVAGNSVFRAPDMTKAVAAIRTVCEKA